MPVGVSTIVNPVKCDVGGISFLENTGILKLVFQSLNILEFNFLEKYLDF